MNIITRLEKFLKESDGYGSKIVAGNVLPKIRFFDGSVSFSFEDGSHKGKTLEESLNSFLVEKGF